MGKKAQKPQKAPKGYKPKAGDNINDYTQTIRRSGYPRTRTRYSKADGVWTTVKTTPTKRRTKNSKKK